MYNVPHLKAFLYNALDVEHFTFNTIINIFLSIL
jgi:hypothetical protein